MRKGAQGLEHIIQAASYLANYRQAALSLREKIQNGSGVSDLNRTRASMMASRSFSPQRAIDKVAALDSLCAAEALPVATRPC